MVPAGNKAKCILLERLFTMEGTKITKLKQTLNMRYYRYTQSFYLKEIMLDA